VEVLQGGPDTTEFVFVAPQHEEIAKLAVQNGEQDYLLKPRVDGYWLPKALNSMLERAAIAEAPFEEKERAQVTLNSIGDAVTNAELEKGGLKTADLATFAQMPPAQQEVQQDINEPVLGHHNADVRTGEKLLAPYFCPMWLRSFARAGIPFSNERATLEGQLDQTDKASTETLRIALQRYRSFFERLLSF
jgi:hypothetical protein